MKFDKGSAGEMFLKHAQRNNWFSQLFLISYEIIHKFVEKVQKRAVLAKRSFIYIAAYYTWVIHSIILYRCLNVFLRGYVLNLLV